MANKIGIENLEKRKGRGRPKGSKNKTTLAAKALIEEAADRIGGVDRMVNWIKEDEANERAFWSSIYPKLLPLQHNIKGAGANGEHLLTLTVNYERAAKD